MTMIDGFFQRRTVGKKWQIVLFIEHIVTKDMTWL